MRGSFASSCGVTLALEGSAVVSAAVPELTAEFGCPSALVLDGLTEDGLTEDGVTEDVVAEAPCFAAATGFVIFGSGRTNTSPSCAFFSFHQIPPASNAQTTTSTNTSTIPG